MATASIWSGGWSRFRGEKSPQGPVGGEAIVPERLAAGTLYPLGSARHLPSNRRRPPHPPRLAGPRGERARGERGRFVLANGSGAMLDAAEPLAGEHVSRRSRPARQGAERPYHLCCRRERGRYPHAMLGDRLGTPARSPNSMSDARAVRDARKRAAGRRGAVRTAPAATEGCRGRPRDPRRGARARAVAAAVEQGGRGFARTAFLAARACRRPVAGRLRRGADRKHWRTGCCPSSAARRRSPASTPAR